MRGVVDLRYVKRVGVRISNISEFVVILSCPVRIGARNDAKFMAHLLAPLQSQLRDAGTAAGETVGEIVVWGLDGC